MRIRDVLSQSTFPPIVPGGPVPLVSAFVSCAEDLLLCAECFGCIESADGMELTR
jgi:hypothetical protein